jgi:anti-anti-sigma regulatory factor
MNVKIDTKEKFTVLSPTMDEMTAKMSVEMQQLMESHLKKDIPHLILNMSHVAILSDKAAEMIFNVQKGFYENGFSFVICSLNQQPLEKIKELNLISQLNITPSESEAWDIVQMEEIERELLADFDQHEDS